MIYVQAVISEEKLLPATPRSRMWNAVSIVGGAASMLFYLWMIMFICQDTFVCALDCCIYFYLFGFTASMLKWRILTDAAKKMRDAHLKKIIDDLCNHPANRP